MPNRYEKHIKNGVCDTPSTDVIRDLTSCPVPVCDFKTEIPGEMGCHISDIHDGMPFQCDNCDEKFDKWSQLRLHMVSKYLR